MNKVIYFIVALLAVVSFGVCAPKEKSSKSKKTPKIPEVHDQRCPGRSGRTYEEIPMLELDVPPLISEPAVLELPPSFSEPAESTSVESGKLSRRAKRDEKHGTLKYTTTPPTTTFPPADEFEDLHPSSEAEKMLNNGLNTSEVLGELSLGHEVDLCFLVDVTGSMSPYIIGVRDSINDIVDDLLNASLAENYVEDLRISFVGYRDFPDKEDHFTILPFTRNVTEFRDFVAETDATGGYSIPEDVFGGMDSALDLDWGEPTRTRLIFHIADAPGHGCDLHLLATDDYPGGDPKERTAEGLFGRLKKMQIQYFFGNITADTDTMIQKFAESNGAAVKTFDIGVSSGYGRGGGMRMAYGGAHDGPMAAPAIYESVKSAVHESIGKRVH